MAQLIYLPLLLLATIQLLTVSAEVEQWPQKGLDYTVTENCNENDWITEFSCTAERWHWTLIRCKDREMLKFKFVAVPVNSCEPENMCSNDPDIKYYYNKDNVIILKEATGPIKTCRRNNTFFLMGASNQMGDRCGNECSDVLNTGDGGSQQHTVPRNITIHLQPSDDWIVNIKVEIRNNVKNYFIKCISGNTDLQFYSEPKTWIEALKTCRGNRSELVHITNQSVWYDVNSLLEKEKAKDETDLDKGVWIGLERSIFGCNPKWMWTSGKEVNCDSSFEGFPVDSLNHHCGKVKWIETSCNSTWLDEDCFKELPFICQRKT